MVPRLASILDGLARVRVHALGLYLHVPIAGYTPALPKSLHEEFLMIWKCWPAPFAFDGKSWRKTDKMSVSH